MKNVHIITGGSSGIGLECAKIFKNDIVLITARNEERLINATNQLKEEGIDAYYKSSDISSQESIKKLFEYARSLGNIKTVINSAGVSGVSESARLTFDIDLVGTENLIKQTSECCVDDTVMILISSTMGHVVPANPEYDKYLENPLEKGAVDALIEIVKDDSAVAYNFSKRGVHLLAKKYANEFGKKGARILSLSPGIIMTPMAEKALAAHPERMEYMKAMTPMGRNGLPEDIANAVGLLASKEASFITGTDILVDGGLGVNLPKIMAAAQAQQEK